MRTILIFLFPWLLYAGVPMLTEDPGVPAYGEFEINLATTVEKGSIHSVATPVIDVNYGLYPKLQFTFASEYIWEKKKHDLGSSELALKYLFYKTEQLSISISPHYMFSATNSLFKEESSFELMLPMSIKMTDNINLVTNMIYVKPQNEKKHFEFSSYLEYSKNDTSFYLEEYLEKQNALKDKVLINLGILHEFHKGLSFIGSVGGELQSSEKKVIFSYIGLQVTF